MKAAVTEPQPLAFYIKKYGFPSYILLTFLISWSIWLTEPLLRSDDLTAANFCVTLGSFGPTLAALIVSSASGTSQAHGWHSRGLGVETLRGIVAGSLALAVSLYCNVSTLASLKDRASPSLYWIILIVLTLLPAILFYCAGSGVGVLKNLTRWRGELKGLLVAFLLLPAIFTTGILVDLVLTSEMLSGWLASLISNPIIQNLPLVLLSTALFGGPLGEEAGWRGIALPHLQKRFSPLLASIILGVIWSLWHLPLHVTGFYENVFGNPLNGILLRTLTAIPVSIAFTWLYNRTHGNLLTMVILHTPLNITTSLILPRVGVGIAIAVALISMIIFDRMTFPLQI